jgi:hypothetical protein
VDKPQPVCFFSIKRTLLLKKFKHYLGLCITKIHTADRHPKYEKIKLKSLNTRNQHEIVSTLMKVDNKVPRCVLQPCRHLHKEVVVLHTLKGQT